MGALYTGSIATSSLATNTALFAVTGVVAAGTAGTAGAVIKIKEIYVGGEATSSTATRICVNRSTAGTGTRTSVTGASVTRLSLNSPNPAGTFGHTYTVAPTFSGTHIGQYAFNAFGGYVRLVAPPDQEVILGPATGTAPEIALKSELNTPNLSGTIVWEEV